MLVANGVIKLLYLGTYMNLMEKKIENSPSKYLSLTSCVIHVKLTTFTYPKLFVTISNNIECVWIEISERV